MSSKLVYEFIAGEALAMFYDAGTLVLCAEEIYARKGDWVLAQSYEEDAERIFWEAHEVWDAAKRYEPKAKGQ